MPISPSCCASAVICVAKAGITGSLSSKPSSYPASSSKLLRLLGVVRVVLLEVIDERAAVGPEHLARGGSAAELQLLQQRVAVDGVVDGLTDALIGERGVDDSVAVEEGHARPVDLVVGDELEPGVFRLVSGLRAREWSSRPGRR